MATRKATRNERAYTAARRKGGLVRAAKLSAKRRREIAKKAIAQRWRNTADVRAAKMLTEADRLRREALALLKGGKK
jgi:hypothetical protein